MIILALIVILVVFIYIYVTKDHDYWSKRGIKHDPPTPLFGNHYANQFGLKSITQVSIELYKKYDTEKVVGYYRGRTPELIIRDPDIIKQVMNIDFPYFFPRGVGRNVKVEPLCLNLFHAEGDLWKLLRHRLTPTFTTAKLKGMFPLVVRCAEKLQKVCEGVVEKDGECDIRELMARYTTEFIGACGFGIEMDTINNENSQFRDLGRLIFDRTYIDVIKMDLYELFPELRSILFVANKKLQEGIYDLVSQIRKQRNNKPSGRNDFIDLLLELEDKGKLKGESIEKVNADGSPAIVEIDMDFQCMAAQVYVFFGAGFETSSSSTSYALHELAHHPEIQKNVQKEIDQVLAKYDNKLCYDAVAELPLLEMVFREGMRKFPSLGVLNRVCSKKYKIPQLDLTIDPGVKILIPVQAIQMDEKYFDNPTEFRPERFGPDAKKTHSHAYLPFGEGPRACIGTRLGLMQSLAGLAALLHQFSVEPAADTTRELQLNPKYNVVQGVKGGLPLRLVLRKKNL